MGDMRFEMIDFYSIFGKSIIITLILQNISIASK